MGTKAGGLLRARAVFVIEIEPGLSDTDHLGVARRLDQPIGGALPLLLCFMRMNTHRAPDVFVALGDRPHALELVEPGTDGQQAGDARRPGARQHARLVTGEFREVEMAVAVDQHQAALGVSTKRGKTPCGFGSVVPGSSSRSKAAKTLPSGGTASWSRIL